MFGLKSHYLSAYNILRQDKRGPVTFNACSKSGIDEGGANCRGWNIKAKRFTVTYPGKYYISLAAYTDHVNGGLVKLAVVKNDQASLLELENDHEDHQKNAGFSGAGTVFRDTISELNEHDRIEVLVTEVEEPSTLTQCKINMFFLH